MQQVRISQWPGGIRAPLDIVLNPEDADSARAMLAALRHRASLWPVRIVCSENALEPCREAIADYPDMAVITDIRHRQPPLQVTATRRSLVQAILQKAVWQTVLNRPADILRLSATLAALPSSAARPMLPPQIHTYCRLKEACRIVHETPTQFCILDDGPADPQAGRLTLLIPSRDHAEELVYPDETRMPLALFPRDIRGRYIVDVPVQRGSYILQPYAE